MTSCDVAVTPETGWKEMLKLKLHKPLEFLTYQKILTRNKSHHLKNNVNNEKQQLYGQITKTKDKLREANDNASYGKIKGLDWKMQNIAVNNDVVLRQLKERQREITNEGLSTSKSNLLQTLLKKPSNQVQKSKSALPNKRFLWYYRRTHVIHNSMEIVFENTLN